MPQQTKNIPVYKQFQKEVRQKIVDGQWMPGQRLPSERELQGIYNISRLTINKSLNQLADEGLLARYQGKGTFVAYPRNTSSDPLVSKSPIEQNITIKYIAPGRSGSAASPIRLGVLEGLHQQLDPPGYSAAVDFFHTTEQYENSIRRLPETSSAAAIWNEPDVNTSVFEYLRKCKFPFVLLDSYSKNFECDYVIGDSITGGRMMVEHLVSLGHTNIVYVTSTMRRTSLRDRKAGFIQGAIEAGMEVTNASIVTMPCYSEADCRQEISPSVSDKVSSIMDELLKRPAPPTAICFSNDIFALNAIQHLMTKGIRVPDDISIVGYDNIDLGEFSPVPLTTISQHWMEIGRCAADVICHKLLNPNARRFSQIMIKPTFILRNSTAKPSR